MPINNLGAVLGWKFNHVPGIMTYDNVIVEWPAVLGPRPNYEDIEKWVIEYEEYSNAKSTSLESAISKLSSLGLTADEIESLLNK